MTRVVNLRHEAFDVYIGRKGRGHDGYFGNPFRVPPGEARGATIEKFRLYFTKRIKEDSEYRRRVLTLKGKRLGCFCKDENGEGPCHGDVYVEWLHAPGT